MDEGTLGTLKDLAERWLHPEERSTEKMVDLIVLKQFLADLGGNTQHWVRWHQPKMVEEALHLAEDYMVAEAEGDPPKRECPGGTGEELKPEGRERGWRLPEPQAVSPRAGKARK